ncbi:PLP-dependent aminotransferase family protein [Rubellicoccus peritrichatus]|uniref:PLP-dependent aminotransferase family protein n=1 Tax=Rubellicoccus peritrichatus TaxID=3080537 RepID=A0AAQ3LBY2_9BACT|nr:PLP-dependent aminotransferase family protein [Puniceicoccus sp. CR14]WOO41050.1 PLP-dependent aminotransferase family protein [Puniceicoccus sp. CR14]
MASAPNWSALGKLAGPPIITDLMHRALAEPGLLSLAAGFTDNTALPSSFVSQAVEALANSDNGDEHLQYGSNAGRMKLREITAERVSALDEQPGLIRPDSVFISNGSQQALYLAMLSLCEPGDAIIVEKPTYFVFLEMLAAFGVEAIPLPGSGDGRVDLEALPDFFQQISRKRVKAVYLNSYFANPTSSSLTVLEKKALAREMSLIDWYPPVIEDGAYRELYFQKPAEALSVMAMPEFADFPRLYTGTFTKPFATGLKIGFAICQDHRWREKLLGLKGCQDFGTPNFNQAIIEYALSSGAFDTHLKRLHRHYREKSEVMCEALEKSDLRELGWSWSVPSGGLYYWLKGPDSLDASMESTFCDECLHGKVLYVPGNLCMAGGTPKSFVRLSFGAIAQDQISTAVARFADAARKHIA